MRITIYAATLVMTASLLVGCDGGCNKKQETPSSSFETPKVEALAKPKDTAPDSYKVKFVTTQGDFTVNVTRAFAPLGADRFYALVNQHFYDNSAFFRVVPGFVVQFGLNPDPAVCAKWKNTQFKDDPVTQSNTRGALTFATSGPNTRTTQLFINLKDNLKLNSMGFSPFGTVEGDGMNVVDKLYSGYGEAGPNQDEIERQGDPYIKKGWPQLDYIQTATITP